MAKDQISPEHRAAAHEMGEAIRRTGFECTDKEVLLAGLISNAIESIVTLASVGTDKLEPRPELDTEAARKLFDIEANGDAVTAIRCIFMGRALIAARGPTASMEKQATAIAQGLVELFAAMEVTANRGGQADG